MSSHEQHLAPVVALEQATWFGTPAVALCGLVWHPEPNPAPDKPVCGRCEERFSAVLA